MHVHPFILAILMLKNGMYRAPTTCGPGEYILGLGKELEQFLLFLVIEGRVSCDDLVMYIFVQGDSLHSQSSGRFVFSLSYLGSMNGGGCTCAST